MARIVLGITGGIAAYKATTIIRELSELGHEVKVIPTANALRFIGATTLEALSHNAVDAELYTDVADVKHVQLGQTADLVIVAPASAAFMARYAAGIADDLLGNTLLATKAPVLIAPAMHTEMWQNPATQRNVATLRTDGVKVMTPATGRLTGSDSGVGRLPEPHEIVSEALRLLEPQDLAGVTVLVTAGGTHEPIDPVRYIGNKSSGKQGIAIATRAAARGATVTLIGANMPSPAAHRGLSFVPVSSVLELQAAMDPALPACDVLVMAAAVSDYRVAAPAATKIKSSLVGDRLTLELIENPDLLAEASAHKRAGQIFVGFAAETAGSDSALVELAAKKLQSKRVDLIVANDVTDGAVFGQDSNSVAIVDASGVVARQSGTKRAVADTLLDVISGRLA